MNIEIPVLKGSTKLMIAPEPYASDRDWFINDHCIMKDKEGILHFWGINNPYPKDWKDLYSYHPYIGHALCHKNIDVWKRLAFAFDESKGTEYLGAPFVAWVESLGKYVMMFESKIDGRRALELAFSQDCYQWERQGISILEDLGYTKRDPFFMEQGDGSFLIYLANPTETGSSIAVVETRDFKEFSKSKLCLTLDDGVTWGGVESPFVVRRKGLYYLFFTYAHRHYYETIVCVSEKYDQFHMKNQITTIHGHAAEIFDHDGRTYITSCGPEDRQELNRQGLYVSELEWFPSHL